MNHARYDYATMLLFTLILALCAAAHGSSLDDAYADMVTYRHAILAGDVTAAPKGDPWMLFREAWPCPTTRRYGTLGDGGKWVCFVRPNCTVLSLGINHEFSFEQELATGHGCLVSAYDPTVDETVQMHRVMRFHKLGVRGGGRRPRHAPGPSTSDLSIRDMLAQNNVSRVDILKVDVEEAEYGMLEELFANYPDRLPFDQLLIEFHLFSRTVTDLVSAVERLESYGFRLFETELNPSNPRCCAELAFVHKDAYDHHFRAWRLADRAAAHNTQA